MNPVQIGQRWRHLLKAILSLAASTAVPCLAQTALTPDSPALPLCLISRAATPPSLVLASPSVPGTTNLSIAGLAQLLAGLQSQLEQTLPVLNSWGKFAEMRVAI